MADDKQTVVTAGAPATPQEQPSAQTPSTPEGAQETQQEQPKYVTVEELAERDAELLRRFKQSDRDRSKRIEGELVAMRKQLEGAGVQVTPEQEAKLRASIVDRIDEPAPVGGAQPSGRQANLPDNADAAVRFVYDQIDDVFAEVGARVEPSDPEWKAVETALNDPKGSLAKTLRAANKAAETKQQRLASQQANAPARVIGGAEQPPGQPTVSSALEAWEIAYKK